MSHLIVFLARPRTGTNYLVNLLSEGKQIESKTEIFHSKKPYGLKDEEVFQITDVDVTDFTDSEKAKLIHKEASKVINYFKLKACKTGIPISFKIFPGHLTNELVDELLIKDNDVIKVIIDRDILPTYVSRAKARKVGKWTKVNTSDVEIDIDIDDFESWFTKMNSWYAFIKGGLSAAKASFIYLDYKEITGGSDNENYELVRSRLKAIGLTLGAIDNNEFINTHNKQDKGRKIQDSIVNWNEFILSDRYKSLSFSDGDMSFWKRLN